ncbi:class I adenylate-forming enzyme family protein [Paracoccus aestuariivivens]|uniref:AMP-binding protein n=1 Tax=Paracoccus aestuariivivens TaxID=1820333 RepID=A0A6L6JCZ4_9RHOB|nr:AMP-binding protein [Paracoccus aestuariivivens]MTH79075.1 AMP-binding protein [Paracoccus aestuariivivens]
MTADQISYSARLRDLAAKRGAAEAVRFLARDGSERSVSWAELDGLVESLAHALSAHRVGQGEVVGFALGNVVEHLALALAIWRLGATTLVLDPAITLQAAASLKSRSGARLIVGQHDDIGDISLQRLIEQGQVGDAALLPDLIPCPGKIVMSGGSTGLPKLMCDSRPFMRVPGRSWGNIAPALGFRADQVQLVCGAMSHNAPFTWAQNGLFEGNTLVLMEKFDADRALRAIDEYGVGFVMLVPTMMVRMLDTDTQKPAAMSSLHMLYHTGAPCPAWLKQAWIDRVGPDRVSEMYGSGENTGQTVIGGAEWLQRRGTVGQGFETDIRIYSPEGRLLPTGTPGEIFMRPDDPQGRSDYTGPDAPTPRRDADGYQSIGDFGWLDADGYLYLAGRCDDVINSGGVKLHPEAIEASLLRHPQLTDVAVFGVDDREWGQRVTAAVVPRDGTSLAETELVAFARQHLSPEEIPKEWRFVEALPRDGFGKLRRKALTVL